MHLILDEDAAY